MQSFAVSSSRPSSTPPTPPKCSGRGTPSGPPSRISMPRPGQRSCAASHHHARASHCSSDLRRVMQPGDVLCIQGQGRLEQLGAAGGFLGHVQVVIGEVKRIELASLEQLGLSCIWPRGERDPQVWKVPVLESTRMRSGLQSSEVILHVQPRSGRLTMIGEIAELGDDKVHLGIVEAEAVEVWQSPPQFRSDFQMDMLLEVLGEMIALGESWSFATAAQALFYRTAAVDAHGADPDELMDQICESWEVPPICTSIVISLWQRYVCKLALKTSVFELDLVLQCMPLRADRCLPGELLSTMESCGWTSIAFLPCTSRPHLPLVRL